LRIIVSTIFFLILISCTGPKKTYWCGDHPCINNAERKAYFKKNMIVEVKKIDKKDKEEVSRIEEITRQARINEKNRIKNEKKLSKQKKIAERKKIKEQKKLAKKERLDEKKEIKKQKKEIKKTKASNKEDTPNQKMLKREKNVAIKDKKSTNDKKDIVKNKIEVARSDFKTLVEIITNKNKMRPYPDINNIPK